MLPIRTLVATFALSAVANFVHASPPPVVVAHIALGDSGEFDATVISTGDLHSGDPTLLWVGSRDGSIEIKLAFYSHDRFHYEIKRNGEKSFSLSGVVTPPMGKPLVIGHFPPSQDIKLWLTAG
jgi:hypothetical protein